MLFLTTANRNVEGVFFFFTRDIHTYLAAIKVFNFWTKLKCVYTRSAFELTEKIRNLRVRSNHFQEKRASNFYKKNIHQIPCEVPDRFLRNVVFAVEFVPLTKSIRSIYNEHCRESILFNKKFDL